MTPGGQDSAFPGVWSTEEGWHVFDQPRKCDTSCVMGNSPGIGFVRSG